MISKNRRTLFLESYITGFILALILHAVIFILLSKNEAQKTRLELSFNSEAATNRTLIPLQWKHQEHAVKEKKSLSKSVIPSQTAPAEVKSNQTARIEGPIAGGNSASIEENQSSHFESAVTSFREPVYPLLARKKGIEGTVRVSLIINGENGEVKDYKVIKSSGTTLLDEAVIKVIPQWRFIKKPNLLTYQIEKTFIFKIK